jgi:DNA adenine methylase
VKDNLRAPFPYFGGKSKVANIVWEALGQPKHYIEPFFGSGAVLLMRPGYNPGEHLETICDKDGHVANVWRSLQFNPDEVARWCDWPVNHADLTAKKKVLVESGESLLSKLINDPEYYDAKLAGYWIWAASCWIGSGLTRPNQRPHLSNSGLGVHKLSKRPHLDNSGVGVHKLKLRENHEVDNRWVQEPYNENIYKWFRQLSERLRYVRIVCGDWTRVCGGNWQDNMGTVGVFFDPPYGVTDRDNVYNTDDYTVARRVREWAIERGKKESYRIVIAGYDLEGEELLKEGWMEYKWETRGGYGNFANGDNSNRKRERLWFSPHCISNQRVLFSEERYRTLSLL